MSRREGPGRRWLVAAILALMPACAAAQQLSDTDRATYAAAFQALRQADPAGAVALAAGGSDPLPRKVIGWLALGERGYGAAPRDLVAFVQANPDWPRLNSLQRLAERGLDGSLQPAELIAFFDAHPPLTGEGWAAYVSALLATGQAGRATGVARDGWRDGEFDAAGQTVFLSAHANLLQAPDHYARADRLMWDGEDDAAERMLPLLDAGHAALVNARLRLMRGQGGVDDAIAAVPAALQTDPGLVYERLRWRRRADLDDGAREMLQVQPFDAPAPEKWWTERSIQIRRLMRDARFAEAYNLAADHRQATGVDLMDAEMTAGWIALRRLGDPRTALTHFMRLYSEAESPISSARGAYWAARAMAELGESTSAAQWYGIAAQFTQTFYGQVAAAALDPNAPLVLPLGPAPLSPAEVETFQNGELARAAILMSELGEDEYVVSFFWALMNHSDEPRHYQLVADLATGLGRIDFAVWAARRAGRGGTVLYDGYPLVALPAGLPAVEPALIHGIIRQESGFDARAVSSAGARGLMQLMPQTAETVARVLGVAHSTNMLTSDTGHNLLLGSTYLGNRVNQFAGSYIMAIAGYNAGPNRVDSWIETYGDPRGGTVDPIDWIELIPFNETRNYVQRVLEGTEIYRVRLGQAPLNGQIMLDLARGG
ncbi:MAG: transglycosylase SLT domain-containing protein [Alphaproteobacteria bacterium]